MPTVRQTLLDVALEKGLWQSTLVSYATLFTRLSGCGPKTAQHPQGRCHRPPVHSRLDHRHSEGGAEALRPAR